MFVRKVVPGILATVFIAVSSTALMSQEARCVIVDGISPYIDTNHSLDKVKVLSFGLSDKTCEDRAVTELENLIQSLLKKRLARVNKKMDSIDYRIRITQTGKDPLPDCWLGTGLSSMEYDSRFYTLKKGGAIAFERYLKKYFSPFLCRKLPPPDREG